MRGHGIAVVVVAGVCCLAAAPAPALADPTEASGAQPTPAAQPAPAVARPEPPAAPRRPLWRYALYTGAGVFGTGMLVHVLWYRSARNKLEDARDANDLAAYRDAESGYDASRGVTIGLYLVGTAVAAAGGVLYYRERRRRTEPAVTVLPLPEGGGMVAVGWELR
jgi:hypothetical protein